MPRFAAWNAVLLGLVTILVGSFDLFASEVDDTFTLQQPTTTRESRFSRSAESEIRFQEGLLHYNGARLTRAEEDFSALVASDPNDAEAWYYLGLSQLDQNRADKLEAATKSFDRSIQLDPSRDEVYAARATALIRARNYTAARADIARIQDNPRFRGMAEYLRGQLLYAEGDLKGASQAFARAKELGGPESSPAGFYEGLTYLRMRELVKARSVFRESSILEADRDPTLASASKQLDAALAFQQKPSKPWEAQLIIGYEYDSNVIQLGSDIPVPAGISGRSDSNLVFQPRGSYSFIQNETWELGLEANGYFTWHAELSDFDIQSYQIGPFFNYKVRENLYLSGRYGFNYVALGREQFLTRNVATPQLTYIEKDFGYTSAYYQFQARQFDGPTFPTLDRDGKINSFGLVQGINLPPLFENAQATAVEISYRFDLQETTGSDFDGKFHTIGATYYLPLPFWDLRADMGIAVSFDRYDHPNSLDTSHFPDPRDREDTEFMVTVGVTKQFTKDIALRVDYSYTNNDSNVEQLDGTRPYEYDRSLAGIRLIMSF